MHSVSPRAGADYLRRQRSRAEAWISGEESEVVQEWAASLIPTLTAWIAREEIREAERD